MNWITPLSGTSRTIKQFGSDEPDRADDQHPGNRANSFDVEQNIIHRAQHQRRQHAEQIAGN